MATSAQFTVTTATAVILATGLKNGFIKNLGPCPLYIGGSDVSVANGFPIEAGNPGVAIPVGLASLESVYGISDIGNTDVRVLTTIG